MLRDRAVNDPSATRWDMQLTSRTVRGADALAEQVRTGAHLGEAVGREVERVVAVRADVDRLRAASRCAPSTPGGAPATDSRCWRPTRPHSA